MAETNRSNIGVNFAKQLGSTIVAHTVKSKRRRTRVAVREIQATTIISEFSTSYAKDIDGVCVRIKKRKPQV